MLQGRQDARQNFKKISMKTRQEKLLRNITLAFCFCVLASFLIKDEKISDAVVVKVEQEKQSITVSVKSSKNNKIQFYMFNIDGKLIKDLNIYGSKKISISQIEKGIYMYEFFSNDERIKSGEIELK